MLSPRWRKLVRDVRTEWGRVLLMVGAISVSLVAVGVVLGAYAVLDREIAASYAGTRPASATLEVPGGVDAALLEEVRKDPEVADAEARDVVVVRTRVADEWRRTLLFVVEDFEDLRLNVFRSESGAWPPPDGSMLVERSSLPLLETAQGRRILVKAPHGEPHELGISGVVHDPGLAPSYMERTGYVYVTRRTASELAESPALRELRIELRGRPVDPAVVRARASEVAQRISSGGHPVHQIRIPPPAEHPHQKQMATVLLMMLAFASMALLLSAILVANSLTAMLARQVREIGVMKAIGARAGQITGLYVALVGSLGLTSVALSVPLSVLGARAFSAALADKLNIVRADVSIPGWVFGVVVLAGVLVPLAVAALPIRRASRITVRQAIDDHGVSTDRPRARLASLPMPLRSALRRPARLALTLGLLAAGGAMFMTALAVKLGWEANVAKVYQTRSYDVEVLLQTPQSVTVVERLREIPGVREAEAWGFSQAAFSRSGEIDVVRTYPDRSHGSLCVMAPPPGTKLLHLPVKAGRWIAEGDRDEVVLNHSAAAQVPQLGVGSSVLLSFEGRPESYRIVGVVEDIGSPAAVYATNAVFARATGTEDQARMFRIATTARSAQERNDVIRRIEAALLESKVGVEAAFPLAEIRTAVGDHVLILVETLLAMAVILAIVGALGLGSAMSVSIVERTRELGVMKTLGATPRRIVRMLVAEGAAIGALSWLLAFVLSVPLSYSVDRLIGTLGFLAPLPLILSTAGAAIWLGLVTVVSLVATLVPARRAAAMVIREALAQT
jgi:putative ABC transport system permease protein